MKQLFTIVCLLFFGSAFSQPGTIDNSFGDAGVVITIQDEYLESSNMVEQPDGKIIVAGWYRVTSRRLILIRYNTDGSIDTSFGNDGFFISDFRVYDSVKITLQPDGKIVATGNIVTDFDIFVARINPNGTLDPTFGTDGYTQVTLTYGSKGRAVAVAPDGKIIVGATMGDGNIQDKFIVLRFNANGTLDNTFGINGIGEANYTPSTWMTDLVLRPDGGIVVCGRGGPAGYFMVTAFTAAGNLDPSFDGDGILLFDFLDPSVVGFNDLYALEIDADGKLYALGRLSTNMVSIRINPDGSLDDTYGEDGLAVVELDEWSEARGATFDDEGRIVAVGLYQSIPNAMVAVRLKTNGDLDETFGNNGYTIIDAEPDLKETANDVIIRPNGKMVVLGESAQPYTTGHIVLVGLRSGDENPTIELDQSQLHLKVFPNPVSEFISMELELGQLTDISLTLLNANGQVVQTFVDRTNHAAGIFEETFLLNDQINNGQYWLVLKSGDQVGTVPLLVMRK
ncbi:MAG: hypothetical protein AAFZ15_10760 [Bacteroidota bacterium]